MSTIQINPFYAVYPSTSDAPRVASVPYDVVSKEEASIIASQNEESFMHVVRSEVDLPADCSPYDAVVYEKARENYLRLRESGALQKDKTPCLYLYRQCMGDHSQVGLVACCNVNDYNNNLIKKHENTRKIKEDDRTNHVLGMRANSGPVFLTYIGQPGIDRIVDDEMNKRPMFHFVADDGVMHTGWRVEHTTEVQAAFSSVEVAYVADGHHRSASAARAAETLQEANPNHDGSEEYNWFLAVLFPASQLHILSYNRTVADLHGQSAEEFLSAVSEVGVVAPIETPIPESAGGCCFYVGKEHGWFTIAFDPASIDHHDPIASLDVELLQQRILTPVLGIGDPRSDARIDFVGGIRGTEELEKRVDSGVASVAFSMFPTTITQLLDVADADLIMPPKSTWFEPKLRSGLFVHDLD